MLPLVLGIVLSRHVPKHVALLIVPLNFSSIKHEMHSANLKALSRPALFAKVKL